MEKRRRAAEKRIEKERKETKSKRDSTDLVRAIGEAERAHLSPRLGDEKVLRDASAAVRLDRAVKDSQAHVGNEDLDHRHVVARVLPAELVDAVCGGEDEEPRGVNLHAAVRNVLDDRPVLVERAAESDAVLAPRDHGLERALRHPDRAHAVVDPARAEATLRDLKAAALAEDEVGHGHAHVEQRDLAMAVRRVVVSEDVEVAENLLRE